MKINRFFPNDTITDAIQLSGVDFALVTPSGSDDPYTVLSVSIRQSGVSSDTMVMCGSDLVALNYSQEFDQVFMNYFCNQGLWIDKTGAGDSSTTIISYVPYDMATKEDFNFDVFTVFFGIIIFAFVFFSLNNYFKTWRRS